MLKFVTGCVLALFTTVSFAADYDVIIRNGTIYDGTGAPPYVSDVAIDGDRLTAFGDFSDQTGVTEIDAEGLAVAPGFFNLLSHAHLTLLKDGRAMSDITQGVTFEVLSEISMSPVTDETAAFYAKMMDDEEIEIIKQNLGFLAGPDGMLFADFKNPELKKYNGKTLTEVAADRDQDPLYTIMDLVIEDGTRVGTVYFLMSEENIKKQIREPWVMFGSDAGAPAAEGETLESGAHPRTYGNVARLLGKYVREEKVISLQEAVRRLTLLPAETLNIDHRGRLAPGYFADLAIFNPDTVGDLATFENPHQYSIGMQYVLVNGVPVLSKGKHTGATPGRAVHGPGWEQ